MIEQAPKKNLKSVIHDNIKNYVQFTYMYYLFIYFIFIYILFNFHVSFLEVLLVVFLL